MRNRTIGYWIIAILGIAVLLFLLGTLLTGGWQWGRGYGMMPGMMFGYGPLSWPVMGLMMLSMILFWIAVILGIVWVVRWMADQPGRRGPEDIDPLEIIRRRYARGEISREEYERLREDLQSKP